MVELVVDTKTIISYLKNINDKMAKTLGFVPRLGRRAPEPSKVHNGSSE